MNKTGIMKEIPCLGWSVPVKNAGGWKVTTHEAFTLYRTHALQLTLHQTDP